MTILQMGLAGAWKERVKDLTNKVYVVIYYSIYFNERNHTRSIHHTKLNLTI